MMVTAEQIMTQDVVVVKTGSSIQEVVELLNQHPFSGLPVVNEAGQLEGIVSEYDLLMHKSPLNYPRFISILGGIIHLDDLSAFHAHLKKTLAVQVDEVMTTEVMTIGRETPLAELASMMVQKNVNRLPVVEEGELVGIVTRADIITAMEKEEEHDKS